MIGFIFFALAFAAMFVLAMRREPLSMWALWAAAVAFLAQFGVFSGNFTRPRHVGRRSDRLSFRRSCLAFYRCVPSAAQLSRALPSKRFSGFCRRSRKPSRKPSTLARKASTPSFSPAAPDWEQAARGRSDRAHRKRSAAFSTTRPRSFARSSNDWEIRHNQHGIPEEIWNFIREKGFLGMLISKEHGGLGFSPQAQSMILGQGFLAQPGRRHRCHGAELARPRRTDRKFGTEEQKQRYLEPLAKGREIPCFALTSPFPVPTPPPCAMWATVTKGMHKGKEVIGIRLNWDKRYITLAPKATHVGLAFHLFDPENLLGRRPGYRHHAGAHSGQPSGREHRAAPSALRIVLPERA